MDDYSRECSFDARDDVDWMNRIVMSPQFDLRVTPPQGRWHSLLCCLHLLYEARTKSKSVKFRKLLYTHKSLFETLHPQLELQSPALTLARQCLIDLYVNYNMNNDEGKRFLSSVASALDGDFLQEIVNKFLHVSQTALIKTGQRARDEDQTCSDVSSTMEEYMGDMLYRIFICVSDSPELAPVYQTLIVKLEHNCLRAGGHNAGGSFGIHRRLLKNINTSKTKCVREFLLNHFLLDLMICGHSPNYRVRENCMRMLSDVFPLVSMDNLPATEHERQMEENFELILRGLRDPHPAVRCAAVSCVSDTIYNYARIMPTAFLEQVGAILTKEIAMDTSSPKVRFVLLEALMHLVQQPFVQEFVYQMILPKIQFMIHDQSLRTRHQMAKLIASTAYLDRRNSLFVSTDDILARLQRDSIASAAIASAQRSHAPGSAAILSRLLITSLVEQKENMNGGEPADLAAKLDRLVELSTQYPTVVPHLLAYDASPDLDKLRLSAALFLYAFRLLDVHESRIADISVKNWITTHKDQLTPSLIQSIVLLAASHSLLAGVTLPAWSEELIKFVWGRFNPALIEFVLQLCYQLPSRSPISGICEMTLKIAIELVKKIQSSEVNQFLRSNTSIANVVKKHKQAGLPRWVLLIDLAARIETDSAILSGVFRDWIEIFRGVRESFWENGEGLPLGQDELAMLSRFLRTLPHVCATDFPLEEALKEEIYNEILFKFLNGLEAIVRSTIGRDDPEYTALVIIPHFVDLLTISISLLSRRKDSEVGLSDIYQVVLQSMSRLRLTDSDARNYGEGRGPSELCHVLLEAATILCERTNVHAVSLQPLRIAIETWSMFLSQVDEKRHFIACTQRCLTQHIRGQMRGSPELEDSIVQYLTAYASSVEGLAQRVEFVSPGICQSIQRQITDEAKRPRKSDQDAVSENVMSVLKATTIDPPYWKDVGKFVKFAASALGDMWIDKMLAHFTATDADGLIRHLLFAVRNLQNVSCADIDFGKPKPDNDIIEDQTEVLKILESVTGQTPQKQICT